MRRQLVASGAAVTIAAAVAFAMPAFGTHEDPDLYTADDFPGGNVKCEDLGLESLELIEFTGEQPTVFEVDPADYPGFVITVIVKGGNQSFVYDEPPFDHLTAPEDKEISHIEVCGEEEDGETTSPPPPPPTNGNGETKTPAPVPTEVPAGTNTGSDSLGLWGLIAGSCAAVAGAAVVVRRRFLHDS